MILRAREALLSQRIAYHSALIPGTRLQPAALPLQLDADGPLMRLRRGAKFAVIVEIEASRIGQAERRGGAGICAISAFADALHRDALGAKTDRDRTEILRDIVDELAVGGQTENLSTQDPVMPDLRAHQKPRAPRSRRSP